MRRRRVGSSVERPHGCGGESVCFVRIEVQVDVGEREPGAVGLPSHGDRRGRAAHRGGRPLHRRRHVLAAGQCAEGTLRRRVTRAGRGASPLGPRKPLGVGAVLWGGDDPLRAGLASLAHDGPRGPARRGRHDLWGRRRRGYRLPRCRRRGNGRSRIGRRRAPRGGRVGDRRVGGLTGRGRSRPVGVVERRRRLAG